MLKYLFILVLLVVLFYSPVLKALRGRKPPERDHVPTRPPEKAEEMVPCAHCGVHVPGGESLRDESGRPYCSAAHRLAGPPRGGRS